MRVLKSDPLSKLIDKFKGEGASQLSDRPSIRHTVQYAGWSRTIS